MTKKNLNMNQNSRKEDLSKNNESKSSKDTPAISELLCAQDAYQYRSFPQY